MISIRRIKAYDAGKHGLLVPVQIKHQQRNHFACLWNIAVRRWHGGKGGVR